MSGDSPLHVLLVTSNYPRPDRPNEGTFVHALVDQWVRAGVRVTVVAPRSVLAGRTPAAGRRSASDGPRVLEPRFLPLSNRRITRKHSTLRWTVALFARAAERAVRRSGVRPDVAYGHFLFPAGAAALRVARSLGVPAAVALGESSLGYYEDRLGRATASEVARRMAGVLSVSETNRRYCVDRFGVPEERTLVLPNAVDTGRFHPRDRGKARRRLGLPADRPLVAFAGHFNQRKGPLRVQQAIERLPGVAGVFLGDGPQRPQGERVLFAGPVPHAAIPEWLCAADAFVLPTLAEGSPNAVLEAMACGLPVVSSDIPALREVAGPDAAVLVDPHDVQALSEAIRGLLDDPERARRMGRAALARGSGSDLKTRAGRIRAWLETLIAAQAA